MSTGEHEPALDLIASIEEKTKASRFLRVHANALELRAQAWVASRRFAEARSALDEASAVLGHEHTQVGFLPA
ncbi:MAG: hypothetical protein HC902_13330 [Calothrix sp. SM1_5_4]|nr:hypothetical protein [Calothrix sp. SM1_5_4]